MRLNEYRPRFREALLAALLATTAPATAATLFVTSERDNTVTVLDSKTLRVEKVIPVGTRPRGIAITPDYREIFVCIGDDDRLDVIDTKTREVSRHIANVLDPELVAIDPVGKRVYAANEEDYRSQSSIAPAARSWVRSASAPSRRAWPSAPTCPPWSIRPS